MHPLTFGDFAGIIKPLPNVALATPVQVAAVGVFKGRLAYTVVTRSDDGCITGQIGPYPESAFRFLSHSRPAEQTELLQWLAKEGQ